MKTNQKKCPECGTENSYATTVTSPAGSHLLPQMGGIFHFAALEIVVCSECGLMRLYAGEEERAKLPRAKRWQRL